MVVVAEPAAVLEALPLPVVPLLVEVLLVVPLLVVVPVPAVVPVLVVAAPLLAVPPLVDVLLVVPLLVVVPAPAVVPVAEPPVPAVVVLVDVFEADVLLPVCAVAGLVTPASAAVVPVEADPDSPPQPPSAIVTLPNNTGQTIRPDPTPRLVFLMRPPNVSSLPVGPDEGINHEVAEGKRNQSWAILTRLCDCPGNPAFIGFRAVRPEVLRPRLSPGLLLRDAGCSGATPKIEQVACQAA